MVLLVTNHRQVGTQVSWPQNLCFLPLHHTNQPILWEYCEFFRNLVRSVCSLMAEWRIPSVFQQQKQQTLLFLLPGVALWPTLPSNLYSSFQGCFLRRAVLDYSANWAPMSASASPLGVAYHSYPNSRSLLILYRPLPSSLSSSSTMRL